MIFGGGKKASQKELRGKIEGILSILEEMAPGGEAPKESAGDAGTDGQAVNTWASMAPLKKMIEDMQRRTTEMGSAQQGLQSEYKKFVDDCQGRDDLSAGSRYQLASDFFSFLVAESAKGRKAVESLGHDFAKLFEGLDKYAESAKSGPGVSSGDISERVDRLRQAVMELASFLSVDVTGPSEEKSA